MAALIDPWPGTAGGAYSPNWGENVRLYVWAAIFAGTSMHWGPVGDGTDILDAGNVWAATGPEPVPAPPTGRRWVDITCDTLDVETHLGGTRADGALARSEAATCTLTLHDPDRRYDPVNPDSPYMYAGRTRLGPGTDLIVFAETATDVTTATFGLLTEAGDALLTEAGDRLATAEPTVVTEVTQHRIFTGAVERWTEPWDPRPQRRRVNVVASDAVKDLAALNWGEQTPVGAGDTVAARIARILTFFGSPIATALDSSAVTLQATSLSTSAWELIGDATDDEIGFTHLDRNGTLVFLNRARWSSTPPPTLTIGCSPTEDALDIILDATVTAGALDDLRNAVYATRTGGVQQTARSDSSIVLYGERGYRRADLGHADDAQVAQWASEVVAVQGWPRPRVESIAIRPSIDPTTWPALLELDLVVERVQILWTPPDATTTYDSTGRVIRIDHHITRRTWDIDLGLALADVFARVLHWGPHPDDQLDIGLVYALTGD